MKQITPVFFETPECNLLSQNMLCYFAKSAFFSLASVYFVSTLHYSLSITAIMLVYIVLTMRLLRIFLAPVIDVIPFKIALTGSMLFCCIGFIILAFVRSPIFVALAILPVSIGFGVNNILIKYAVSLLNLNHDSLKKFARFSISVNLGTTLGPLIGNFFIYKNNQLGLCFFSASIFFICAIFSLFISNIDSIKTEKQQWFKTIKKYFVSSEFTSFFIISIIGWFFYGQLFSSLPLFVSEGLHASRFVFLIFTINSLVCVFLPVLMSNFLKTSIKNKKNILLIAFSSYTAGFLLLCLFPNLITVILAALFFSLGEIIILPSLNACLTSITASNERIISFTLSALAAGIGEGLGSLTGTYAIKLGQYLHQWRASFLFLLLLSLIFLFVSRYLQRNIYSSF